MAIKNSFVNVATNRLSRNFGGTMVGTSDPYTTGMHFISFAKLPPALSQYSGGLEDGDMKNLLTGACLSVTPPGGTLNKIEYTGLGGVKFAVPGSLDYGNSISIKFLEFNQLPIFNIFHGWFKMIRDYRTGTSNLIESADGMGYSKSTYAGLLYYWTTSPDAKTVEYYACYDGLFPTKDPQDLFSSDVESIGRLDIEMEFNVDYIWHEDWVKEKCQSYADNIFNIKADVIEKYGNTIASGS